MIAGRELDAEIAGRVFGLTARHIETSEEYRRWHGDEWFAATADIIAEIEQYRGAGGYGDYLLPAYSTDIAAAWLVVERLVGLGYPTITVCFSSGHRGYIATVWRTESDPKYQAGRYLVCIADEGLSAPLAICLAALKTVE